MGLGQVRHGQQVGEARQCRAAAPLQQDVSTHTTALTPPSKEGCHEQLRVAAQAGPHLRLQQLLAQRLPLRGQLLARPGRGAAEVDKPDARGLARGGLRTEGRERFCGKGWPHCTAWHVRRTELCKLAYAALLAWVMCSKFSSFSVRRRCACAQPAGSRQAASNTTPAHRILRPRAAGGAAAGGSALQTASTQRASWLPKHGPATRCCRLTAAESAPGLRTECERVAGVLWCCSETVMIFFSCCAADQSSQHWHPTP